MTLQKKYMDLIFKNKENMDRLRPMLVAISQYLQPNPTYLDWIERVIGTGGSRLWSAASAEI
jgi:hypothetical protein